MDDQEAVGIRGNQKAYYLPNVPLGWVWEAKSGIDLGSGALWVW